MDGLARNGTTYRACAAGILHRPVRRGVGSLQCFCNLFRHEGGLASWLPGSGSTRRSADGVPARRRQDRPEAVLDLARAVVVR